MLKPRNIQKAKKWLAANILEIALIFLGITVLDVLGFPFIIAILAPTVCMMLAEIVGEACDYVE